MRLSHSDIDTAARCLKQYEYRSVRKLQNVRRDKKLRIGAWAHEMLRDELLALAGIAPELSASDRSHEIHQSIVDDPELFQDEKEVLFEGLSLAYEIVQNFLTTHDHLLANWRILHVEEEFVATIGNVEITFTPDLVVQEIDTGDIWIIDWKTTDSIPDRREDSYQQIIYTAGVRAVYPELKGFKYIWLRKKLPVLPRLNKTKTDGIYWVNDVKRVDTTYELLRDFIEREAPYLMDEPTHYMRLQELLEQDDRFVKVDTRYLGPDQIQLGLEDAIGWVDIINLGVYPRSFQTTGFLACGSCEFNSLCHTELLGLDPTELIELEYEPREPKNVYDKADDEYE